MNVQRVAIDYVNQTWPLVEKFIDAGVVHAKGDYTLDQIKTFVTTGQWMLLVVVDDSKNVVGGVTISFFNRPNDRVAFITTTGGVGIITEDCVNQLKNIVKAFGATYIEAAGRESMVRLLERRGFKEKYRIVGVKL